MSVTGGSCRRAALVRVLAVTLTTLLATLLAVTALAPETVRNISGGRMRPWMPIAIFGPFILYEWVAFVALSRFMARRREPPRVARFVNAAIETSLPTVIIVFVSQIINAAVVFGSCRMLRGARRVAPTSPTKRRSPHDRA